MKLKRLLCAGLLVVVSGLIINAAFGAMGEGKKEVMATGDNVASGQAVEEGGTVVSEGVSLYNSSSDYAYKVEGGYIYFDESTGTITDCDNSVTSAVIPSEINGVKVTGIGGYAFRGCISLSSVVINEGVISVGDCAFWLCSDLTSIEIPDSVTIIGSAAFQDCSNLTSIKIPKSVTNITGRLFEGCSNLISIEIPEGVTSIEYSAFEDCSGLTSVEIPESVISIGRSAFSGCSGLKTAGPIGGGYDYEFGWKERIPAYAFNGCSGLTSIEIPEGVTSIEYSAFEDCSGLTSVEIPEGVTSIGDSAFLECSNLKSIEIPESVTSIGRSAFSLGHGDKVFYVKEGSYADTWAKKNNYKVLYDIPEGTFAALKTQTILLNRYDIGDVIHLSAYMDKDDSPSKLDVVWSSSDENVASVAPVAVNDSADKYNYKADVTAKGEGSVKIYAMASNGNGLVFNLSITKKAIAIEQVLINGKEYYDVAKPHSGDLVITLKFNEPINMNKNVGNANGFNLYESVADGETASGTVVPINSGNVTMSDERTIVINFGSEKFEEKLGAILTDNPITPADTNKCAFNAEDIFPITLNKKDSNNVFNVSVSNTRNMAEAVNQYVEALNEFERSTAKGLENEYSALGDGSYNSVKGNIDSMLSKDIGRLPVEAQEACRRAMFEAIKSIGSTNIDLKFSSNPLELVGNISKAFANSFKTVTVEFDEPGYRYKATANITAMQGVDVGSIYCVCKNDPSESYTIGVASEYNECSEAVATFMNELSDFGTEAVINVATTIMGEYTKAFGIDKYIDSVVSDKLIKYENSTTKALKELIAAYEDGKKIANAVADVIKYPEDPLVLYGSAEELMNMEKDNPFAKTGYTSGSAYNALVEARDVLIDCAVYYVQNNEMPEVEPDNVLNWIKNTFKCPVDIYVYDEAGNEIGSIVNDEITVNSDSIRLEKHGDEKVLYILEGAKVSYKLSAYDYGMLNITEEVKKDGFVEKRSNIYDIPLDINDVLTSNVISENNTLEITGDNVVYTPDAVLTGDDDGAAEIKVTAKNGTVYGDGTYVIGDRVSLMAVPDEGYYFAGWYKGSDIVSATVNYEFTAKDDVSLKALFEEMPVVSAEDDTTESTSESTTETTTADVTETTTETTTDGVTETTTEKTTETTTERVTQTTTEKVTETTTEKVTVTEEDTETTTEMATVTEGDTETTTRRYVSTGGGGAGASSLTVNGYRAETTTDATTENTTEEVTEVTTEASLSDVRVTIGEKTVVINGEEYNVDAVPYIQAQSNSTLVPLRFVALAIAGGDVEDADNSDSIVWDAVTKTASITFEGKVIEFMAGSNDMVIDGEAQVMDYGVAAEITEGRMFVPFRALGKAMGVNVEWDSNSKTAIYSR